MRTTVINNIKVRIILKIRESCDYFIKITTNIFLGREL